jgi:nucleotide-binding universal stress UspA family protein
MRSASLPFERRCISPSGAKDPFGKCEQFVEQRVLQSLTAAQQLASEIEVASETIHVKDRDPAIGIVETAEAGGADLIVMASHGRRGLTKLVLGSITNDVLGS